MEAERWRKIDLLLQSALDLAAGERAAFLTQECGADQELRRDVEALLSVAPRAEGFLASSPAPLISEAVRENLQDPWLGRRMGPYRIVELLGRGGMSSVYLAERDDSQYVARVAVKIMRPLSGDLQFPQRFSRERQILADLDHPNIARLIDSGSAGDRPFFVMEYVEGIPFDRYCSRHKLSLRRRLRIFLKICQAVGHAHQKLVVHRDLKPGNILITTAGEPKLLDFGIAKLMDPEQSAAPATAAAQALMTPAYAAPEQLLGGAVTTATDIYSLGLLLFQSLVGVLPYRLGPGARPAAVEKILQGPIPLASDLAENMPEEEARKWGLSRRQLGHRLRGDLDLIVRKALEPDADRRYPSVEQLAADICRHLDGYPVRARPPTWHYRLGRYVRREKAAVLLIASFALLALSSSIFAYRLTEQKQRIQAERDRASAVSSLIQEIFDVAAPNVSRGDAVTARELLDNADQRFAGRLEAHPDLQIDLLEVMTDAYHQLGIYDRAEDVAERNLAMAREHLGIGHPRTFVLACQLAAVYELQGEFTQAEPLARLAVTGLKPFPDYRRQLTVAEARLASILGRVGRQPEAESLLRSVIEKQRAFLQQGDPDLAHSLHELGVVLFKQRRFEPAEKAGREALDLWHVALGGDHPKTLTAGKQLAYVLLELGKIESAESLTREVLVQERKVLGEQHPSLGFTLARLARIQVLKGNLERAEGFAREALDMRLELLGQSHPAVAVSRFKLAEILLQQGSESLAEPLFESSLAILREKIPGSAVVAHPLLGLGRIELGRSPTLAERHIGEALEIRRRHLPADDFLRLETELAYGRCLGALNRQEEAREVFSEVQRRLDTLPPSVHHQRLAADLAQGVEPRPDSRPIDPRSTSSRPTGS